MKYTRVYCVHMITLPLCVYTCSALINVINATNLKLVIFVATLVYSSLHVSPFGGIDTPTSNCLYRSLDEVLVSNLVLNGGARVIFFLRFNAYVFVIITAR